MTQQEFTKLTNIEITDAEYEVINGMYDCNENMSKQEFCDMFLQMSLISHVRYVVNLKVDLIEAQHKAAKTDEYETAYSNTMQAHDDLRKEYDAMQDRAIKAERDAESYKNWWMGECEKSAKLNKRLDTIKSIIEL